MTSKSTSGPLPLRLPATPQQVLGPYFLANAPFRSRLHPASAVGSSIRISGQVLSEDMKALVGATVHVWLADPKGVYDNQDADGNPLNVPLSQQLYRGRLTTNKKGGYSFTFLRPGNYFDEGAQLWRPAHIHIIVEAAGHKRLVTQLYFQDDPHNTDDIEGDDFFQPELVVQISPAIAAPGVTQSGVFNFVLK